VLTRRTILLAPWALAAQSLPPRVQFVWVKGPGVPEEFARESVVFPRAYRAAQSRPDVSRTPPVL
jgi:hypothetical protein